MLSLLKIEWLKIKKYPAFWWMLGIVALTIPGINMFFHFIFKEMTSGGNVKAKAATQLLIGNPYSFPEVWHSVAFFSSLFVVIPAVLVIMIVSNEFTYKTNRQNIIDGWSRSEFVWSKLIDVLIISVIVTLSFAIIALTFGITNSSEIAVTRWSEQIKYIPLFLLQTFSQLSIAFLLGFVIKRSFISLGAFLFYFLILENIFIGLISKFVPSIKEATNFFPLEISDKLIPPPAFWGAFDMTAYQKNLDAINMHIVYTIIFTAGIWWLCFAINRKRDL